MTQPAQQLKIALLQLLKVKSKEQNVNYAIEQIRQASKNHKAKVFVLPECFAGPYEPKSFTEYSEHIPNGPTCLKMSSIAKELNIYIVAGSLFEKDGNKIYNTCTVWGPQGNLLGKHRKIHLYDADMDEDKFHESDLITPGNDITIVNIEGRKIGIAICYDMRFEELARIYRNEGCDMLIYPAAVNLIQAKPNWELILRARANDNQLYVAGVSSARDESDSYILWGHTMCVDPYGKIIYEASEKEEVVICDLDFNKLHQMREQTPLLKQRRTDIYDTIKTK